MDRRVRESGREEEESEEIEVGWARGAREGRVMGLGSAAWVAILDLHMRNEEEEEVVWVGGEEFAVGGDIKKGKVWAEWIIIIVIGVR